MATDQYTSSPRDDVVLWIVISFCLVTPVILTTFWAVGGTYFPPMLLSVLLGIAVAALTYRYLGGTTGSQFSVGVLKVAGSAALMLGTAYLTDAGLSKQMDAENSVDRLRKTREQLGAALLEQEKLSRDMVQYRSSLPMAVESLSPDSAVAKSLVELSRQQKGPWSPIESKRDIWFTVVGYVKGRDKFASCEDANLSQREVRLVRKQGDDVYAVKASFSGLIESAICDEIGRKFTIQVSCQAGLVLLPEHIQSCDSKDQPKWKSKDGARSFSIRLEVLPR